MESSIQVFNSAIKKLKYLAGINFSYNFLTYVVVEDYNIDASHEIVIFPAGEPVEMCILIKIVDNAVTLEGSETFTFEFETLPAGVFPGSISEAIVSIKDDDDNGKVET